MRPLVRAWLAATLAAAWALAAHAQPARYPERPVRIVVPFPAPGAADLLARAIAQGLGDLEGQPIVVENRPGAAAAIGAEYVARSAPDGHTLLLGTTSSHAIGPAIRKLAYDPLRDFAPITMVAHSPFVLAVHPDVPARSTRELIALAKLRPGKLDMASFGNGSASHVFGELFKARAGVYLLHIPYKGSAAALTDLIAGRVHLMFDNLVSVMPHARAGKLRVLAVTTASRAAAAPDLPPIADELPGYEAIGWFGLFAPAGTRREVVELLNSRVVKVLGDPALRQRLAAQGMEAGGNPAAQFADTVARDLAKWTKVVKESGASFD